MAKKPRKQKVIQILTLSVYNGLHRTTGKVNPEDHLSFAESLSPLHRMIAALSAMHAPLGSKIKVTMEVI